MSKFKPLTEDEIKALEPSLRESYQKNFKALIHFNNLLIILEDHKFTLAEATTANDTADFVRSMAGNVMTKVNSIISTLRGASDDNEEENNQKTEAQN